MTTGSETVWPWAEAAVIISGEHIDLAMDLVFEGFDDLLDIDHRFDDVPRMGEANELLEWFETKVKHIGPALMIGVLIITSVRLRSNQRKSFFEAVKKEIETRGGDMNTLNGLE